MFCFLGFRRAKGPTQQITLKILNFGYFSLLVCYCSLYIQIKFLLNRTGTVPFILHILSWQEIWARHRNFQINHFVTGLGCKAQPIPWEPMLHRGRNSAWAMVEAFSRRSKVSNLDIHLYRYWTVLITLPETNSSPLKIGFWKESSLPTIHFQVLC